MEEIINVLFVVIAILVYGVVLWVVMDQGYKRGYKSSFIRSLMTRHGYSQDQAEAAYKKHWAQKRAE